MCFKNTFIEEQIFEFYLNFKHFLLMQSELRFLRRQMKEFFFLLRKLSMFEKVIKVNLY